MEKALNNSFRILENEQLNAQTVKHFWLLFFFLTTREKDLKRSEEYNLVSGLQIVFTEELFL